MSQQNLYAYGVVEAGDAVELETTGVGGVGDAGGESVTVYPVEHGPLAAMVSDIDDLDPERTDENVEAHDEVLRTVMVHDEGRTVVPMRFGMAFKNERTLKNVLRNGRRAFRKALNEVDGTYEVGIKVLAPEEGVDGDFDVQSAVAEPLGDVSVEAVENDLFSDRLLLNRSYLVERDGREAFDDAVDDVREDNDGLTVQYTGPWAPYNFVDIQIGAEQ